MIQHRIVAAMAAVLAVSTHAQQVEYVTRNVEPTHAVRFNSQPLRISITDRGVRTGRGDLEPATEGRHHHSPRHGLRGGRSGFYAFGGYIRSSSEPDRGEVVSLADRNRARTIYGSERRSDGATSDTAADRDDGAIAESITLEDEQTRDARRQEVYDRLLPLIEARREKLAENQESPAQDSVDAEGLSDADEASIMTLDE